MEFVELRDKLISNFNAMVKGVDHLFEVELDKDELWNTYLDSFPAGTNPIYRERRVYDCSCCRHFIKDFGNVVVIKDGIVKTIWDFETEDDTYQPVMDALSAFVVIVNKKVPKISEKIPHLFYRERHPYRCHIPFYYVFS